MTTTVESIIDFLQAHACPSALTPDQATSLVAELKAQINGLSITVPNAQQGAVTLLYSGIVLV